MDHLKEFLEFVKTPEFRAYIESHRTKKNYYNSWNYINSEATRKYQKKYEMTEKGKIARQKVNQQRKKRMAEESVNLDSEQKKLIREFYKNTPEGYEVDHIVPIGKGGKHCLSNLQYLTKKENRKKAYKLFWENNY